MTTTSWARPAGRRGVRAGLLAATLAAAALLSLAPGAQALPVLVASTPDRTDGADGRVEAIARIGNRVYIGGSFTIVGGQPRAGLAALDATTGAVDRSWRADVAGEVAALAASADGTTLYVGGLFTSVGGASRENLAAVAAATGAVTGWNPGANRLVASLAASATRVYVGGKFARIGGAARAKLAAVDPNTGAVDTGFAPNADNWVAALALSPGGELYAAGFFTAIGGAGQPYLAALSPATGASTGWRPSLSCPAYGLALAADGGTAYVACGGSGGSGLAFSTASGARLWLVRTNGNLHAVARLGDAVYLGGHFTTAGSAARKKGLAVDADSGALTAWNPSFNSSFGVFAMLAVDGKLWAGGDFTKVGSTRQARICRFS